MPERTVDHLASAVADHAQIDWASATEHLTTSEGLAIAAALHDLSRWSSAHASGRGRTVARGNASAIEAVRVLAITQALLGAITYLYGMVADAAPTPSYVIHLAVIVAFSTAAAFLDRSLDTRARFLAGAYWIVAAAFAFGGLTRLGAAAPAFRLSALLVAARPEAWLAASMWLFAREFPRVTHFAQTDHWCAVGIFTSAVAGVVLFTTNLIAHLNLSVALVTWCSLLDIRYQAGRWFWLIEFTLMVPALAMIALRAGDVTASERRRARLFLYSIASAFAPVATEVIAESAFPAFQRFLLRSPNAERFAAWAIYGPLLALPALTAYAVVVTNVLDTRVMVQQAVRYLLTRWLVTWGAIVPFAALAFYVYRLRDETLSATLGSQTAHVLIWANVAALVVVVFRSQIVAAVDRRLLRGFEERSITLARMTERLKNCRTPIEIIAAFADGTQRALQAPAIKFLFRDRALVSVSDASGPPVDSLIPVLLSGAPSPCVVEPDAAGSYYALLSGGDRDWIERRQISILVPLSAGRSGGGLFGVVAYQQRRSALTFSDEDLRFLVAASAAATLAHDGMLANTDAGMHTSDELAVECTSCGRVEESGAFSETCVCGGLRRHAGLPHTLFDRFRIVRRLGAGGMGVAYLATDLTIGREVAVKTLPRLTPDAAARLIVEARMMAAQPHANIAILYSAERWRGTPVLIMEYCAGDTLARRLKQGPLTFLAALALTRRLAEALSTVHHGGHYHGDIKPSNIGLSADGDPKFLDFGLSRTIADTPQGRIAAGTAAYLSPEVLDGHPPGPTLDVWALTVVLFEALTATHPFMNRPLRRGGPSDMISAIWRHHSGLGEAPRDFFARALAESPTDRYPITATDFIRALAHLERSHSKRL